MKNAVFALALAFCASSAVLAAEKTEHIKVSGWKCDKCPQKTATALKGVKGVESATADRSKNEVVVKYDDSKAKRADLDKAIADSGFSAEK
jgi:copper chaperone CopZ